MKRRLVQMNLFKNQPPDDRHVHYQRIATRLYIFAIIISSIILILSFSLTEEIHRNSVLNPTESEYNDLYRMNPNSLVCPCTSLSMNYEVFVTVEPIYHQICLSDFVSPDLINLILNQSYSFFGLTATGDLLGLQLQLLSSICEYARQTINDSLRVLYQTQLVSSQVIAKQIFDSQINFLIDSWKLNTINGFQQVLQLIRATSEGNKLLSNVFNYYLKINYTLGHVNLKPIRYSNCLCDLSQTCSEPHSVTTITEDDYLGVQIREIPSFFYGCQVLEAMLQSTLECLYDQSCVTAIQTPSQTLNGLGFTLYINSTLKITDQGSTEINETVESIVNRLMVNLWLTNISFTSFYNSCAPSSCTYEYTSRRDIYVVFATAISVLGGLSILFKILILIGLRFIEKIMEGYSRRNIIIKVVRRLFTCRTEQQIASRINLVLLLILLFVFYLVSVVPSQITTVQITKPSLSTYNAVFRLFPDSLQCSCSKISFKYQTFLTIEPRFHPICSSDFMSNRWIMYVYGRSTPLGQYNNTDFRATAVGQFQLLISFCKLSEKAVNSAILKLNSTDHIDTQIISEDLLNNQIQTTIDTFQSNTPKVFLGILDLIREMTQANQLMSMYSTNWKYKDLDVVQDLEMLNTISQEYEECNCGLTSKCTQTSGKMRAGCYPLEALLQSTLECFYDQDCIDPNVNFTALNFSSISTFNINSNIETILRRLMVEEYSINKSYENYFDECSPSSCSYSYTNHHNTINSVTSAIGIYGGSVIISRLITVFVMKLYRYRVNQIIPQT